MLLGGGSMGKVLGLSEDGHKAVAGLFLALFMLGVLSSYLYFSDGEVSEGLTTFGICAATGLLPALIFLYFGMTLARRRLALETMVAFIKQKQRVSVLEVAQEFKWTDPEAEDNLVEAINENMIRGHFDRGTKQFYTEGSQQQMTFFEKCEGCGVRIGLWASPNQPAVCPYCGNEHQGQAPAYGTGPYAQPPYPVPQPYPQQAPPYPVAQPPQGQVAAPSYPAPQPSAQQAPPYPQAQPQAQQQVQPQVQPQAQPQAQPQVQPPPVQAASTPYPGPQAMPQQAPPFTQQPSPYPQQGPVQPQTQIDHSAQRKKGTVKFLFLSATPDAMLIIAAVLIFFGLLSIGASVSIAETYTLGLSLMCGAIFYGPLLILGVYLVIRSLKMDKYLDDLIEMADYIVTFRRIEVVTLMRKMDMPEERVRQIVTDIFKYKLLEGQVTPDWSEIVVNLRPEDTQVVPSCPYCKAPGINVQVIRGGSERCPYCDGVVFFSEGVVA
jgi:hypothetical protein